MRRADPKIAVAAGTGAEPKMTVREAVFHLMRGFGMTTVFGNPGSTEIRFFRNWPADFRYVLGLQESCVVAMADGYAQASRNAALVNLHSAAGVGHALGSVFTAYRNQTPLVITAGQQTRAMFSTEPYLYATEAAGFPRPYVKWSVEPARAQDVPAAIARAYYTAMQKPCGPVFVSIPEDDWDVEAELVEPRPVSTAFAPDPAAMARLTEALESSTKPVLVVGAAVDQDGAWEQVIELAERIEAAVWVSPLSSRCSFPEKHRLFAGFLPPLRQPLADRLAAYDAVLVLGAPVFTYHVHTGGRFLAPATRLFQLTDDAAHAARSPVGESILCTLQLGLRALLAGIGESRRPPGAGRKPVAPPPATDPPTGEYLMGMIARLMPRDAIIVEEAPTHREALHDHLPIQASGGFYAGASGGLGWALPAAIGVAMAEPKRKVIGILGDGSSLFSIQALWTAAQRRLPVAFVIFNNSAYGALKSFGRMLDIPNAPGHDLPGVDFVSVAEGFGCRAVRVEKAAELETVLRQAFGSAQTWLIDARLDTAVQKLY